MKWSNVKLIFFRETRDQLRDRRTLFTIAVLPVLLYPLLGMVYMQMSQFLREHPTRIWIIGAEHLPESPRLLEEGKVAEEHATEYQRKLLEVHLAGGSQLEGDAESEAEEAVRSGRFDAVLLFRPDFAQRLHQFQQAAAKSLSTDSQERQQVLAGDAAVPGPRVSDSAPATAPDPKVFFNAADDKSRIAYDRINRVLRSWRRQLVKKNLENSRVPFEAAEPFTVLDADVAEEDSRRAAAWSKILPFIVFVWALTGAFYPAIDLCAGEKERGTLETLLSSPARREEIVWGKLLTVMSFSMATSLLNLASMGCTGFVIFSQLARSTDLGSAMQAGPPPISSVVWLILALIPMSALFSALALAIAAFARSSKEGQYYLVPLLMITLPLIMAPLLPTTELDLGTSLIPVSGLMLLLRAVMEGEYRLALLYLPPVSAITGVCCLLAVRWAVEQFRNESVLFRENERFDIGLWFRHLVRDRRATPNVAEALACGVLLLLIRFFAGFLAGAPAAWSDLVVLTLVTQVALIAGPPVIMACFLTKSPTKTLLLQRPPWKTVPVAVAIAACLHPSVLWLGQAIHQLYPMSEETVRQLEPLHKVITNAPLLHVVMLLAVVPAICEELAFRGFVLSGLRHVGRKWTAIMLSSAFFGIAHGLLQQSLSAFLIGLVIGYIAVQSGSLAPAIAFHATHNALALCAARISPEWLQENSWARYFVFAHEEGALYQWPFAVVMAMIATTGILWFKRQPYQRYREESLTEAIDKQSPTRIAHGSHEPASV